MKFSKQRELIYKQVMDFPVHPTADEVYSALKVENPNLSLGTVYRNLNLLSENGMLMKIHIADGSDRFDGRTDDHYHMICDSCSKVYDVEIEDMFDLSNKISKKYGYSLTAITLTLRGLCTCCIRMADEAEKTG